MTGRTILRKNRYYLRGLEPDSTLPSDAVIRRMGTSTFYHVLACNIVVPNETRIIAEQGTVIILT